MGLVGFVIACSTKKDTFLARNAHAVSTEYNVLYNGGIALESGLLELRKTHVDNFWELLPIERMAKTQAELKPEQTKNANFERAETKAIKAIQKHSMNIGGSERNPQIDEAHLLLGKARYFDQRFVPALEAFNYILYKYPSSDKIYEAKIWREKTNIRLDNDAIAVANLTKLLKQIKFKDQVFADANAILAQAYLNLEEKDSAAIGLKKAIEFTKNNEEKARYRFILGQLQEELGQKDSAFATYQSLIEMNRKSPRDYVIHAKMKQAQQFDYQNGDTLVFLKNFKNLIEDRENRPFLDVLHYQKGLFYDKRKKFELAKKEYNKALKTKSQDSYLNASTYRNLAEIYFNSAKYSIAGNYYDSTLVHLNAKTKEFKSIKKKRENLADVIKFEGIATRNDSILRVVSLTDEGKIDYFNKYIEQLKKEDELKKIREEKQKNAPQTPVAGPLGRESQMPKEKAGEPMNFENNTTRTTTKQSTFYFYNAATVAFGRKEFKKKWGDREFKPNWRISSAKAESQESAAGQSNEEKGASKLEIKQDPRYTVEFYSKQLPTNQLELDSIAKERNFAYYQLGIIYKEKFKENQLAIDKLEQLLKNNPEQRLVLPSLYNLYKLYEITDKNKAQLMKDKIISLYPDSRYAQLISLGSINENATGESPETVYKKEYELYESGDYRTVLSNLNKDIEIYFGDPIVPKFETLKAYTLGKIYGVSELKKALNFVALNYPNNEEGKAAELFLAQNISKLEQLKWSTKESKNWKILYKVDYKASTENKEINKRINSFMYGRTYDKLTISQDCYTETEDFIVIHGIKSEDRAKDIATILKEYKEYTISITPIILSSSDYEVVQINKNIADFIALKTTQKTIAPTKGKPENPIPPGAVQTKINEVQEPKKP